MAEVGEAEQNTRTNNSPIIEHHEIEHPKHDNNNEDDQNDEDDHSTSDEDLEEVDRYWPPPIKNSIRIVGNTQGKTLSTLAFNNAGTRFAAGGNDHQVHIWDFEALDENHPESICSVQPSGQTVVKHLDFSNDDEQILVISGSCQAVVIAKDGIMNKQHECPKGDQYMSDMASTIGHIQMLNDGQWNPKDKSSFITCSNDCTIRIWDIASAIKQKTVIKTRSPTNGLKAMPNVCRYSRDALSIITGCNDGSVMMWDTRRKFITTSASIRNAHLKGSEITGIEYSYGQNKICTRSEDESCKLWDCRQLRKALAEKTGLTTLYSTTDCVFSPDDKYIITGTSNTKSEPGQLLFLDASCLSTKSSVDVNDASVIGVKWHPKINHIGYSCSNGLLHVNYDETRSLGGFLSSGDSKSGGKKRKKYPTSGSAAGSYGSGVAKRIITPHALPLFRDDQTSTSFAKLRQDPKRSYKPEMPVTGASAGGRIKPAGSTLSSYVARSIAKPIENRSSGSGGAGGAASAAGIGRAAAAAPATAALTGNSSGVSADDDDANNDDAADDQP